MNHAPQLATAATNDPIGALVLATGSAAEADAKLGAFIREHCICRNCFWVVARPRAGVVTCRHPECALIDGVPHVDTSCCECHDFADFLMAADLKNLVEDHYAKATAEGLFDLPNVKDVPRLWLARRVR